MHQHKCLQKRSDLFGQNAHKTSVLVIHARLARVCSNWPAQNHREITKKNTNKTTWTTKQGHNKQIGPEIRQGKVMHSSSWSARFVSRTRRFFETAVQKRTHTQTNTSVPFLFARSSFRGLSKNMASEEDALKKKETQICLRVPGFPFSKIWRCLGQASAPIPLQGPQRKPAGHYTQYAG